MRAQAVVFTGPNQVQFQSVECPDPGDRDVVVKVTHSWISNGTEGSFLRGERIEGDTAYRPGDPWPFPLVAGYQRIGVIESVGAQVEGWSVGESVFSTLGQVEGMYKPRGGQVSPSVCSTDALWKIPTGVAPLALSGLVLTQVGYNCASRPEVEIGQATVVIGDGLVGQWAAQTLAWRGAQVALVGRHEDRLQKFAPGPGRYIINARQQDWYQALKELFPAGIQAAVDTVGSISSINQIQPLMRRFGHIVSAGFYGTQDALPLQPPRNGELSIHLVSGWTPARMDQTLHLVAAGHLQTLPLITHHFPVAQAAEAWQLIQSKSEPVLGVILDW